MAFDINTNVLSLSGLKAAELDGLLSGTGLAGLGQSFINLEVHYGINALFAMAHAIIESAWGNSYFAENRNNLFGIDAYDSNPNNASAYPSKAACIDYYGRFLKTYYLTPGGAWYSGGTTIHNVFVHYSSSHDVEGQNIANIMNELSARLQTSPVVPSSTPQYIVQENDNLSSIAVAHGLSLQRIEDLNPQLGPPAGRSFDLIHAGDVVYLTNQAAVPSQTSDTYKVITQLQGYETSNDAANHQNPRDIVMPGEYGIFNQASGMINVTPIDGKPGSWINPADNVVKGAPATTPPQTPETGAVGQPEHQNAPPEPAAPAPVPPLTEPTTAPPGNAATPSTPSTATSSNTSIPQNVSVGPATTVPASKNGLATLWKGFLHYFVKLFIDWRI